MPESDAYLEIAESATGNGLYANLYDPDGALLDSIQTWYNHDHELVKTEEEDRDEDKYYAENLPVDDYNEDVTVDIEYIEEGERYRDKWGGGHDMFIVGVLDGEDIRFVYAILADALNLEPYSES